MRNISAGHRRTGTLRRKEAIAGLLLISPWVIGFVWFLLIPLLFSIYASFTRWTLINPPPVWIGLDNYRNMLRDGSTIIYLSGLQNIPGELYDAATVDGANPLQKFFSITLPMLSSTLFFLFITGIIGAFQIFTPAYILSGASSMGSNKAINFYVLHIYMEGFRKGKLGYASALAWLLVIIAAVIVILIYRRSEQYVYYETTGDNG